MRIMHFLTHTQPSNGNVHVAVDLRVSPAPRALEHDRLDSSPHGPHFVRSEQESTDGT